MGAIFLSYAREDRASAETLARVLGQAGHDVWWDRHIDGGEEFATEIEAALDKADAVLVAWSADSVKSRWVRDEASVGCETGRLVPVAIDGSKPPMGFRQFHTLDLTGWKGAKSDERTAELLRSIDRRLEANGVRGTTQVRIEQKPRQGPAWARRRAATGVIVAAIFLLAGYLIVQTLRNPPSSTPSVALLPFSADASDAEARKMAAATRDAVAHTLSQGAFAVSTINAAPQGNDAGADFMISGQVTTTPEKVVATVRMEETDHHVVVFSHQFEANREEAWELPEMVGAQVASQLSWTAPIIAIERRHPSDPAVVGLLLQSSTAGLNGTDTLHDFERSGQLAAKAPNSPLAQDNFAFSTAFALSQIPRGDRVSAVAAARKANDRTVELAPEYNGGYIAWCLLRSEVRARDCEDHLRAGMEADPDGAFANFFLADLYNSVGRNREAMELASLSLAHDQYMPFKIALALRMMEVTGRTSEADELYQRSMRWWPKNEAINYFRLTGMLQRGDFRAAQRFDKVTRQAEPNPVLAAIVQGSASRVRQQCSADLAQELTGIICMLGLVQLGELGPAFFLAERLYPSRKGRTAAEEDRIWLDNPNRNPTDYLSSAAAVKLRRDPRFLELAGRVGLLDYWRSGRLPDFCTVAHEPICASLARGRR